MKIILAKDYNEASRKAANIIAAQILSKPASVIGLATGSTPIGTYDELVKWYEKGDLSFEQVTSINLDEYVGLDKENDQSYFYFMRKNLHSKVDINPYNVHLPNGIAPNQEKECQRYDSLIDAVGGIDLQLLGIGLNGHVGFNEPDETISNGTYVVELTQSTIDANKRFFEKQEDVPKKAYTMGIGTILRAKKTLMVVTGKNKADILKETLLGPITPQVPASLLRLHNDCTIILDEEAYSSVKTLI